MPALVGRDTENLHPEIVHQMYWINTICHISSQLSLCLCPRPRLCGFNTIQACFGLFCWWSYLNGAIFSLHLLVSDWKIDWRKRKLALETRNGGKREGKWSNRGHPGGYHAIAGNKRIKNSNSSRTGQEVTNVICDEFWCRLVKNSLPNLSDFLTPKSNELLFWKYSYDTNQKLRVRVRITNWNGFPDYACILSTHTPTIRTDRKGRIYCRCGCLQLYLGGWKAVFLNVMLQ